MKQTAVEWLISQIKGYESDCEIFEAAKVMEKEQIMNAYKHELDNSLGTKILAEQYYNETFKSE